MRRPVNAALVGEVEDVEGLDLGELGSFHACRAAVGFPCSCLDGADLGEELFVVPHGKSRSVNHERPRHALGLSSGHRGRA